MTAVLDPPALTGLNAARTVVGAAARAELWPLTDTQLAQEIADALALKAQAEAVLLARLGEADARRAGRHPRSHLDDRLAARLASARSR